MYVARFSYSIKPVDRERALGLLGQEVEAARGQGLEARLLVPLTRPPGGAALQYELVLPDLDAFEAFREEGLGGEESTRAWLCDLKHDPAGATGSGAAADRHHNDQTRSTTPSRRVC